MERLDLVSLFLLGLFGTGHCIGMCGPLVFAFPGKTGRFVSHLAYHGGRLGTYTLVGLLMGGLGAGLARLFSVADSTSYLKLLAQIQVIFSLVAGVFLMVFGLAQMGLLREPRWLAVAVPEKIPGYRKLVRSAFAHTSIPKMMLVGLVMGFLPCGLSYAAFSRALATADPVNGGLCLVAFGLGTMPGLLFVGTTASHIARRFRRQSDILSGMLMVGMGVMLLVKAGGILTGG
jgi:sulfite exporter TauE/SafE